MGCVANCRVDATCHSLTESPLAHLREGAESDDLDGPLGQAQRGDLPREFGPARRGRLPPPRMHPLSVTGQRLLRLPAIATDDESHGLSETHGDGFTVESPIIV
jgi:hypothetical protein